MDYLKTIKGVVKSMGKFWWMSPFTAIEVRSGLKGKNNDARNTTSLSVYKDFYK